MELLKLQEGGFNVGSHPEETIVAASTAGTSGCGWVVAGEMERRE